MRRKHFITFTLIFIIWVGWTNMNIETTTIKIENDKIPAEFDGVKIAHVSDLHNHQWGDKLIEKIEIENPDIIAITGDLVDSRKTNFDIAFQFIQDASEIAPIYYVTGNHESRLADYALLKERLENASVNMMDDYSVFIEKENKKIQISGIQDPDFVEPMARGGIQGEIVRTKLNETVDKNYFNIVLSHRPEHFEQYVRVGADLVLTGHAHGGQVRIPFLGGLVAPNQGLLPNYTNGVYEEEDTAMIVSRGLGNSIIPVRINNRPELVVIQLKQSKWSEH